MTAEIDIETSLKAGASEKRAWNRAQLALIGVPWPPPKGWKAALILQGFELPIEVHERLMALRTPNCGSFVESGGPDVTRVAACASFLDVGLKPR